MASSYPGAADTLAKPTSTTNLDDAGYLHDVVHTDVANAVEAVQATLGVNPQGGSATVVARLGLLAPLRATLNAQTGTTYTLVLSDEAKLVTLTNAAAITLTVPTNATVAFPVGSRVDLVPLGAGMVTVAGAGGVTIRATPSAVTRATYGAASLLKLATDEWLLVGDLA